MISTTASDPERDTGEQRAIVQQQVGRAAAALALVHEVEVAEDSVERKRNRQAQPGVPNFCSVSGLIV